MDRETIMVDELQDIPAIGRSTNASNCSAIFDIRVDIGFILEKAYRYVTWVCGEEFATYGITPAQFIVLMHLEGYKSESQRCLSQITGIDRTTIVEYLIDWRVRGSLHVQKLPKIAGFAKWS